ncbi:F0F1 ATP synthase subunit A [Arcanobacterium wilhelmae]|nr:F0F1 ATP synthase subunit A [Arcanobacterium wilhelmae]WFN91158.1 F0F1 ATP synthase subunit A [Arcanobacterium wilhelmae]
MLSLAALPILAGEFEPPTFDHEFKPAPLLFAGTPFELNRILAIRLIAALVLMLVMVLYAKRAKLVPSKGQAALEGLMDFAKVNVGDSILGEEGRKYQPLLLTIFLGIFFMNITGVIPGLQIAGTSLVGMPLIYALVAYVAFIAAGLKARGPKYFLEQVAPHGLPKPLYLIIVPIELVSTFIIRPITLTVRLLANMIAGHFVLALCFVGTHYLFFTMGGIGYAIAPLTLLGGIIYVVFEMFIAALQAYIFAILTAVYISLSVSEH